MFNISFSHFSHYLNLSISQFQCRVLGSLHLFTLARSFVVQPTKVQNAMNDDAMQFFVVGFAKQFGIRAYRI